MRRHAAALAVIWVCGFGFLSAAMERLTPNELRGKEIYLRGRSPSGGEITALMGESRVEVPASVLPCAKCHGYDGQGRPEGGVTPTDITWDALTKPYGVRQVSERSHRPYTRASLKRAIAMGSDPDGNVLHVAMPRYLMSSSDMDDLLAYCMKLGLDLDPGVSKDVIRVGTILPPPGKLDPIARAIHGVLSAYLDTVNSHGGIYNRRLELVSHTLPGDPSAQLASVESFLLEEDIFALVGPFIAGTEREITDLVREMEVPTVGPFTLYPQSGFPMNRHVFYLYSGLTIQGLALLEFEAQSRTADDKPSWAVLQADDSFSDEVYTAFAAASDALGWSDPVRIQYDSLSDPASVAKEMYRQAISVIFLTGGGVFEKQFLRVADELNWHPRVLASGATLAGIIPDVPESHLGQLFLSFPSVPQDRTATGKAEYQHLLATYDLPRQNITTQLSTMASAKVFVEGLKRAGRGVSRAGLTDQLEGLYEFDTGFSPLISFGPNRRIGAYGSYIVGVDPGRRSLVPLSGLVIPRQ